jgi:hypothetical protein
MEIMINRESLKKLIFFFLFISTIASCVFFSDRGEQLFAKGRYTIYKKNLMSYYLASPDLFVKTEKGEVKINLNPYSVKRFPQEKISSVEINEITSDSIQIHFISKDTSNIQSQIINLNVKQAVDSIQAGK